MSIDKDDCDNDIKALEEVLANLSDHQISILIKILARREPSEPYQANLDAYQD
jgi:hypothetical protein